MNFSSWPALLVVDVEGNGTNPPDLVEVAALPVRDGQPDESTAGAWLTKPNRPVTPFATRVHGLTNQVLEDKPGWEEIKGAVHAFLGTAWIAAHNAHVDHRVLSAHLPQWQPAGVIDTLRLAKATYPDLAKYDLDTLIEHVEPDLSQALPSAIGRRSTRTRPRNSSSPWPAGTRAGTSSWPSPSRPACPAPPNQNRSPPCGDRTEPHAYRRDGRPLHRQDHAAQAH